MNTLQIVGIIISVIVLAIIWVISFSLKTARELGFDPAEISKIKSRFQPSQYPYTVTQEQLSEAIKEVFDSFSPQKKKQLRNVQIKLSGEAPSRKMLNGKTFTIFGEYKAIILFYPNTLFDHNESLTEYLEHFKSLVRHEVAHHFGMNDEEIENNKKTLGITK